MKINDNTKISDLIKADKNCVDAIAAVAPPLHRLKNPILRKVMASRVNLVEAAKMGGCTVEDIVQALIPLGFEYEKAVVDETVSQPKPDWLLKAETRAIIEYDVRPIIESGSDPLKVIMAKFKEVQPGGILCVINSFVPTPLIHLLKQQQAEDSYVDIISPEESRTYFLKKIKASSIQKSNNADKVIMNDEASFKELYDAYPKDKIREIDVRHLEMPMPMRTILGELETLPKDWILYVNHKRVPLYLLEELADKNYEVHIHTVDDTNVKLILFEK